MYGLFVYTKQQLCMVYHTKFKVIYY